MSSKSDLIVKTILSHLKSTGDLKLVGEVVDGLRNSVEYKNSKHHVHIASAVALDSPSKKSIESYLHKSIGSDYELDLTVDPDLLAGFTMQIDDTFIDASVLGKINTVSNILTAKD